METSNDFAANEEAARERCAKFKASDPFPQIDPALLSSADIEDYARETAVIYPFDTQYLKPTTYALTAGGPYIYWENGKKFEGVLEKGQYLHLKKDSILFLTLEPLIQLPNYIAARFNLSINHVYRGLLLGTGPVVDPGFIGRISMPLHNFTSNDYIIKAGEKLVWMEFTKLAKNPSWSSASHQPQRRGSFVPFSEKKNDRVVQDYVYEADRRPIESSIPLSVIKSEQSAKIAEKSVKSAENFTKIVMGVNLGLIIATVGFGWTVYKKFRRIRSEQPTWKGSFKELRPY
jgi:deoxycytidine triphosphate deaminase